jgi:hypothetical protein
LQQSFAFIANRLKQLEGSPEKAGVGGSIPSLATILSNYLEKFPRNRLQFNPTYPHVDNIDQGAFCVPEDGISIDRSESGPACLIQSDFSDGEYGNFEVVALQESELTHWWHDNSDVNVPWRRAQTISTQATGSGWIIQSDFRGGDHGNFEVVVLEGSQFVHYFHDNSDVNLPWQRAQTISMRATGPGCIIQSDFKSGDHGNFEVAVLEGNELVHYFHDNSDVNLPWQRAQTISTHATAPGCAIQSDFKNGDRRRKTGVPDALRNGPNWHELSPCTNQRQRRFHFRSWLRDRFLDRTSRWDDGTPDPGRNRPVLIASKVWFRLLDTSLDSPNDQGGYAYIPQALHE